MTSLPPLSLMSRHLVYCFYMYGEVDNEYQTRCQRFIRYGGSTSILVE